MPRLPLLAILPPVLFAGLAAMFYIGMSRDDPDALPSTFIGKPAPAITAEPVADLATFDDETLREPGLKLVNFWASWCAPCRAEHPTLLALSEEMPIYGVNQDVSEADAMAFLDELGDPFAAVVFDRTKRQSIEWGVYGLPETFLVDGDGTVLLRIVGPLTRRVLEAQLRPALDRARAGES